VIQVRRATEADSPPVQRLLGPLGFERSSITLVRALGGS
jgi:N-acetylglutamate synthase-like GNAT family acetyltransferase